MLGLDNHWRASGAAFDDGLMDGMWMDTLLRKALGPWDEAQDEAIDSFRSTYGVHIVCGFFPSKHDRSASPRYVGIS